jgi:anti-sigma regulatory factor (Ser/Thr protein kinase)
MFGEFLTAAKILLSKNVLGSVRDVFKYLTSAPEWKRDIVELKAKIKKRDKEQAKTFGHAIRLKMQDEFGQGDVTDFLAAFYELADNAFSHGCESDNDSITLRAVIFGAGVSAEVINNNKSKTIPDIAHFKNAEATGVTGRGLMEVLAIVHHATMTHDGRGIKIVLYKRAIGHYLEDEGITFINVGGFSVDVATKISRSLRGKKGDVIIIFGPDVHPSSRRRAAAEVEKDDFVGRFAIVTDKENRRFLSGLQDRMPKLVGCFESPEDAISALRPPPQKDEAKKSPRTVATKRRRK